MRATTEETPLFYDLSKEEMEAQCPDHLRVIIRKAFDNCRSGYGPGPTMADVIRHYEDEQAYRTIRGCSDDYAINEILDTLFEFNALMEGVIAWRLPSMVSGSDQTWHVGRFSFTHAKRTHPKLFAKLQEDGWYN
jgi:hypothetical protein